MKKVYLALCMVLSMFTAMAANADAAPEVVPDSPTTIDPWPEGTATESDSSKVTEIKDWVVKKFAQLQEEFAEFTKRTEDSTGEAGQPEVQEAAAEPTPSE